MTKTTWTPEELTKTSGVFFQYTPESTYLDTTARYPGLVELPITLVVNQAGYHRISKNVISSILTSDKL